MPRTLVGTCPITLVDLERIGPDEGASVHLDTREPTDDDFRLRLRFGAYFRGSFRCFRFQLPLHVSRRAGAPCQQVIGNRDDEQSKQGGGEHA